jgi:hypothetical protein
MYTTSKIPGKHKYVAKHPKNIATFFICFYNKNHTILLHFESVHATSKIGEKTIIENDQKTLQRTTCAFATKLI